VDSWVKRNKMLEDELATLRAEKEEMAFILAAHKTTCSRRKVEEELLDPEEEQKRRMRRDRNRLAAAKCRKRRLDQIDTLQVEVDSWVKRNKMLEDELATLRAEKEEMAFILAAHKTTCKLGRSTWPGRRCW